MFWRVQRQVLYVVDVLIFIVGMCPCKSVDWVLMCISVFLQYVSDCAAYRVPDCCASRTPNTRPADVNAPSRCSEQLSTVSTPQRKCAHSADDTNEHICLYSCSRQETVDIRHELSEPRAVAAALWLPLNEHENGTGSGCQRQSGDTVTNTMRIVLKTESQTHIDECRSLLVCTRRHKPFTA